MSEQYNTYLANHIKYVNDAFFWLRDNEAITKLQAKEAYPNIKHHDESKYFASEYFAYDNAFYGTPFPDNIELSSEQKNFDYAWLHHIHNNPHHWQHWVVVEDDTGENVALEMPAKYAIEMVCDWWSFSWNAYSNSAHNTASLLEVCSWYECRKNCIMLHDNTRKYVVSLLDIIYNTFS